MASKRHLRKKACQDKERFPDKFSADAKLHRLQNQRRIQGRCNSYHCRFCGGWHYGHLSHDILREMDGVE